MCWKEKRMSTLVACGRHHDGVRGVRKFCGTELRFGSAFVQESATGPKKGPKAQRPQTALYENKRNQETVQLKNNSHSCVTCDSSGCGHEAATPSQKVDSKHAAGAFYFSEARTLLQGRKSCARNVF